MTTLIEFSIEKVKKSRLKEVDFKTLEFGKEVSDHMLIADYKNNQWCEPKILPYGPLLLSPTALGLHYGQTVFEGMKAFRMKNGKISIFRIEKHFNRFNRSLERMCMPAVPYEIFAEGIKSIIDLDREWVPAEEGTSTYIRPFMFASQELYGVRVSTEYKFIIFAGPVGAYFPNPLKVKIENKYIRAARGGTGYAKCGGNYGGSFYPASQARLEGFDQVLWTDLSPELNIEESGTMNIMFVIDGKIVTPALSDTILDGVTRDSIMKLAIDAGILVEERKIGALELEKAFRQGKLQEAFGVGTAVVVAPIQSIYINGIDYQLPKITSKNIGQKLHKLLNDIRTGYVPDKFGWNTVI